jgi:hypothetical protein
MIIHDLKHPTEAIVGSLKLVHQELTLSSAELLAVKMQNDELEKVLKTP